MDTVKTKKKRANFFEKLKSFEWEMRQIEATNEKNKYHINGFESVEKTTLDCSILKINSVVNYKLHDNRNYNQVSKNNLKQYNDNLNALFDLDGNGVDESEANEVQIKKLNAEKWQNKLKELENQKGVDDVNSYAMQYQEVYYEKNQKEFWGLYKKPTKDKIFKITSVFAKSILSCYNPALAFKQKSLCFATFTLSEPQKHTDREVIAQFVDFIDHLKKVENYLINPVTKERTKEKGMRIENYFWRAETQENGNIHFHLIADCFLNQDMLRRVWNNYLQKMGYAYAYNASNVQSLKRDKSNNKIKSVERYLCKYMTKIPHKKAYLKAQRDELKRIYEGKPTKDWTSAEKFRRPIIGKSWGCSNALTRLEFPKYYGDASREVMKEIVGKLKRYVSERIPEQIRVYTGNVRETLKTCAYEFQKSVKDWYNVCYRFLYDRDNLERKMDEQLTLIGCIV